MIEPFPTRWAIDMKHDLENAYRRCAIAAYSNEPETYHQWRRIWQQYYALHCEFCQTMRYRMAYFGEEHKWFGSWRGSPNDTYHLEQIKDMFVTLDNIMQYKEIVP